MRIRNLFRGISVKRAADEKDEPQVWLIAGLGNPGKEYEGTRHNAGFEVLDLLAEETGIEIKKKKFAAMTGEGIFEGKKLIFLKPQQYMNRSGQAVATALGFYKLGIDKLLVIADCMDIEPGNIRLKAKGSAGGHNGLKDIVEKLGTNEFARLRVGIGKSKRVPGRDFVLAKARGDERDLIEQGKLKAKAAVMCWLEKGMAAAMNEFNQ